MRKYKEMVVQIHAFLASGRDECDFRLCSPVALVQGHNSLVKFSENGFSF
jgi:hypothetical protein